MCSRRNVLILAPFLLAGLALFAWWVCLPHAEAVSAAPLPAASPVAPDPDGGGWLELVRTRTAHDRALAPQAALSVNVDLTDKRLAGTAPGLAEVTASVLRDGYQIASGSAMPVPDPLGNFYTLAVYWQTYPLPAGILLFIRLRAGRPGVACPRERGHQPDGAPADRLGRTAAR